MRQILFLLIFLPFVLHAESKIDSHDINFTAYYSISDINGKVQKIQASKIDWKKVNEKFQVSPFQISILLKDMNTGDSTRDEHMLEILGYPEHTSIVIKIQSLTYNSDATKKVLNGTIMINGISKPFETEVNIEESNQKLEVSGKFKISLKNHDVKAPSLMFISVKDTVNCDYKLTLLEK